MDSNEDSSADAARLAGFARSLLVETTHGHSHVEQAPLHAVATRWVGNRMAARRRQHRMGQRTHTGGLQLSIVGGAKRHKTVWTLDGTT